METVLNTAVPRFLQQLAADYQLWAAGGDEATRNCMAQDSSLSFSEEEEEEEEEEQKGGSSGAVV